MRIIKRLAKDIECNIREAEEKMDTAYRLKAEYPAESAWYREMAASHLSFNQKAHELIKSEIEKYKASDIHKQHPEYVDGMMAVWSDKHADLTAYAARIRSLIDSLK